MFLLVLLIGSVYLAFTAVRRGPRAAAVAAFALAVLLPCWVYLEVGAVRIDVRTALGLVGLGCIALHPHSKVNLRIMPADALLSAVVGVILISELSTGVVTITVVAELIVQWVVPYLLGRMVWNAADDGPKLIDAVAPMCLLLAAWAAVESITRVNPLGLLAGHVGSAQAIHDLRWGLRRAEGPLIHPIFFGLHLVLMMPWAMAAASGADETSPWWKRRLPWIVAAGAFFTMSRGPQLGVLITCAVVLFIMRPIWRQVLIAPVAAGVLVLGLAGDVVLDVLHTWSGETPMTIELRGEMVPYSGTTHRWLQIVVYADAVAHAGWTGYGSGVLRAGDTQVPYVEESLRQMFTSIDNHYLQFVLQCGFLGLGLFVALCLTSIYNAFSAARRYPGAMRMLAAATGGALGALTLLMSSVWLAGDYRFLLLATIGSAVGLRSCAPQTIAVTEKSARVPTMLRLNLTAGRHAPAIT